MKSLVAILHYNTVHYTDSLYEMLKPYERNDYDLIVIDNGSNPDKVSKHTLYQTGTNTFYGGGLDMALDLFIGDKNYDSFSLLNSDIVLHGYNYFKTLREQLFSKNDLMLISPCVIQPIRQQTVWKQMHCWNSTKLRYVPFVDYNAPFMKREFAEKIGAFGSRYGWVQDFVSGIVCEKNNWKIAVCDWVPIVHVGNGTVKENPKLSNYNILAQEEADRYFEEKQMTAEVNQLKLKGFNYKYEDNQ